MSGILFVLLFLVILGLTLDTFYIINSPAEQKRTVVYCHEEWPKGVHSWSYNYSDKLECFRCGYKPEENRDDK